MNTITVTGNIGKDIELRYTPQQLAIAEFPVAVTSGKDDKKKTTWFNVKVFGQLAENLCNTLTKGDRVIVTGRQETDEYTKKDGSKGSWTYLIADEVGPSVRWTAWVKDQSGDTMKKIAKVFPDAKLFNNEIEEDPF